MKSQAKPTSTSKIDLSWAVENQTVWVMLPEDDPSGEACTKGVIVKLIDEDNIQVQIEGTKEPKTIKGDIIYPINDYKDFPKGYEDMVDIENLSEAELLHNLRIRFKQDMIYTYVGPTLVVLNPYKAVERILLPAILHRFQSSLLSGRFDQKENPPHVFAIAAMTMKNMFENKKNQAIVISGESGAGKTENTKSAMKFLTSLGKANAYQSESTENIEDKILACNPILEAFGNAKTVRNDNSSRFGKYVALLVEKDTKNIVGATITNYLLEKSRVVSQNSEERNYHIFYAFLRGASEETLKSYFLTKNLDDWAFLKNSYKGEVKTVPDVELYKEVTDSFKTMKFTEAEQNAVWTYTAAALMVGNLDFDETEFSDSTPCQLKNEEYLINAAKILNIDYEKFSKSLRFKTRVVGSSIINSTVKRDECITYRDSLSKDLFNKLFNWLVRRLNFTVMPSEFTKNGINMSALMAKYYHIGLLDIFGFEIFNFNSIEQFCINFSNEKLQQLYISYVFKGEEKEFINEGLKDFLCELNFKDNQSLIDMLDSVKLPGIFQMIDESCSVSATDQNLYDKIVKQFKKPEFALTTPKISRDTFIVKHTAKEVEYNINGFRAKNKDEISKTIEDAICGSGTPEIAKVWKNLCLDEVESEESKNAKPNPKDKFLGYKFRAQMKDLMEELNSCECHFIRCLKPNEKKQADFFLPQLVLQQIKYMGIIDTIKVRKDSFPVRTPYRTFYEKYQELAPQDSKMTMEQHIQAGSDFKQMSEGICKKLIPSMMNKMALFGTNKMFLRIEASKELERLRRELENKKHKAARMFQNAFFRFKKLSALRNMRSGIRKMQLIFRMRRDNLKFLQLRKDTQKIQRWWKTILHNRRMEKFKGIVATIQKWWKMKVFRKRYIQLKAAIIMINRVLRGARSRLQMRKIKYCKELVQDVISKAADVIVEKLRTKAARTIQRYAKGYICRSKFRHQVQKIQKAKRDFVRNKMIKIIQRYVSGFIVRSSYKRLRKSAMMIQGHMRMKWLSSLFQRLRLVSIIIQKAVRRWLITKKVVRERMQDYMNAEGRVHQAHYLVEQANFFGLGNVTKSIKMNDPLQFNSTFNGQETILYGNESYGTTSVIPFGAPGLAPVSDLTKMHSLELMQNGNGAHFNEVVHRLYSQNTHTNTAREIDGYSSKKIHMFSKVVDVEMLTDPSLLYDPMWSAQILQLQNECAVNDADIQLVEVGQAHTLVATSSGKVFSFGWNDCLQLGRPTQRNAHLASVGQLSFPVDNFRPRSITSGDDHSLLLDYQGNIYVWGDNSQGQLGLGHSREVARMGVLDFLSNDSVAEIKAKGNNSLVVTQSGKAFYWPLQLSSGEKIYKPAELSLPPKVQISTAACGYNFAVLISKNGLVFTFGRDNQAGQLGHGDTIPRDTPTLVESLKEENELIVTASCGYKHVVCKSKLGKVYTWGWGQKGQLGHGELENEFRPRLLNLGPNTKVSQAQAGFSHSLFALNNRKLLWCGSNASLEYQAVPLEVNLQKKIPDHHKEFTPVKILCAWSKTMNVTYATFADTRTSELNLAQKQKVLSTLTSKIEENRSFNHVDLPVIETIAKHFHSKIMKDRSSLEIVRPSKQLSEMKNNLEATQTFSKVPITGLPRFCDALSKMRLSPKGKETRLYYGDGPNPNRQKTTESSRSPVRVPEPINIPKLTTTPNKSERSTSRKKTPELVRDQSSPSLKSGGLSSARETIQQQQDPYMQALNEKFLEIKRKMNQIMALPREEWTATDIQFLKMATEPKMLELIQNTKF